MKRWKKLITYMIIQVLCLILANPVMAAANEVRVYVDGVEIQFPDQKAYINSDNRTLVPVRFVSEALGAEVDWNQDTKQVNVKHNGQDISLTIGEKKALVNEREITLDTTADIVNSRTMVPLRFVSECLEVEVEWNGAQRAVYITTANSDQALVDSDLVLFTSETWDIPKPGDLSVLVLYYWATPVEPQIQDLKELLEKRFGDKAQEIVDYVAVKKEAQTMILPKEWVIDSKTIRVHDNTLSVSITVRG